MKYLTVSLSLCGLLLLLGTASCQDSSATGEESVRNILDFDSDLPRSLNLDHLLSKPSQHEPFNYHQDFLNDADGSHYFSYDPRHEMAPHNWKKQHPFCGGDAQSPMHLRSKKCVPHTFSNPLRYPDSEKSPIKVTMENNGYSIGWKLEYNGTRPHLTGGPLKSNYVLEGMHLHWGLKSHTGSEHMVDGEFADAELHMLHRNVKYASDKEAALHPDGLVVVGMLISASKLMRPTPMFKNIQDVREPYTSVTLAGAPKGYVLKNILGFMPSEPFLAYRGSLTTPPCNEAVLWLVAPRVRKIAYDDVSEKILLYYLYYLFLKFIVF